MLKILSHVFVIIATAIFVFLVVNNTKTTSDETSPVIKTIDRTLDKYSIENLSRAQIKKSKIELGEILSESPEFTTQLFSMQINPNLDGKTMKKLTGVINMPVRSITSPVILMLRGYVDPSIYSPGVGTRRSAEEYAKAGFITVAPDFLGYGGSDENAANILESRFQTYTTALSVLLSIDTIPQWDRKNVFIWGHSNGGTIALTLLEITGVTFPTSLWAPVSKPFPYSVLYYTDESEDKGKFLRSEIAKFEAIYDANKYSIDEYFDKINAPIILHQGTLDDAVPLVWSSNLAKNLQDVKYFTYPAADHNLQPGWNTVVERDIAFFKNLQK